MSTSKENKEELNLSEQIKNLIEKLEPPKRKSVWEIMPIVTTFLGTVVLAAVSLYVTQSSQRQESERTHAFHKAEADRVAQFNLSQLEMQKAQVRVEELKAVTALAPLLASHDAAARAIGKQLLQAVGATAAKTPVAENHAGENPGSPKNTSDRVVASSGTSDAATPKPPNSSSLIDHFAAIALSSDISAEERVAATRRIGEIAASRSTSPIVRERAADVAVQIASSVDAPPEVKDAAAEVIARIKSVTPAEAQQLISSQPIKRKVTEVILHDAGVKASWYKGAKTIYSLAELQMSRFKRAKLGWHFAITSDGAIWLGVPLDDNAIHASRHNNTSIAVMLLMDGKSELPTDAQRSSLAVVLQALFARLKLDGSPNSPDSVGFHFHRDYDLHKTCPGPLLTKEMVLAWRAGN